MAEHDPELAPEDAEGGLRKSFWGHVQDLRTALVRSAIAIGLALMVCLLLDAKLVALLERPLHHLHMFEAPKPSVTLEIGTTKIGPFPVTREQFPLLPEGAAPHVVYRLSTTRIGNEDVVTLKPQPSEANNEELEIRLHNLSPAEAFFVAFHVALYGALAVSSPFWIFYLGGFILPALNLRERKIILSWLGWGVLLLLAGVLLTYFVLLPVALRASIKYSELLGFNASDWRADEYISFVCKFLLGMGIGFQFPLVVLFFVKIGVLTHQQLVKWRRHVVVLSLVLGAVLTTPEVITQIAMAVPLYLLYEMCIWISWYWERQKRKNEPAASG